MGTRIIICTKYNHDNPFDSLFWFYVLTKSSNLFQRPHLFTERPLKELFLLLSGASGIVVLDLDWPAEA